MLANCFSALWIRNEFFELISVDYVICLKRGLRYLLVLTTWNYPEVADSFTLRHRNLLHCILLVISRAQVS